MIPSLSSVVPRQYLRATASARGLEIPFLQPFVDHARGTADPGINRYRLDRAVEGAGPALHAGIAVADRGLFLDQFEHLVRADLQAPATADAGWLIQFQLCYVFQIA